jgi:hypothetical protein
MISNWLKNLHLISDNHNDKAKPMEMIITGHSHCFSMGVNPTGELRLEPIQNDVPGVFGVMGAWNGSRDDAYWQFVAKHAKGKYIVISWAGNQHNSGFIFSNEESFDFVLNNNERTPITEGRTMVPKSVLVEHFKASLGGLPRVIDILQKGNPKGILLLETPRPKGDGEFILPFIKASQHFIELAQKLNIEIDSLKISSLSFRLKLWQVIQELVANIAKDANIQYVSVPVEFQSSEGGLKKEFWANDVTHANSLYGKAVVKYLGNTLYNKGAIE